MRKVILAIAALATAGLVVTGCSRDEPRYDPEYSDVASYNQQQSVTNGHGDAIVAGALAGAAGYALGKSKGRKEGYYDNRSRHDYRPYRYSRPAPRATYKSYDSWKSSSRPSYTGSSRFSSSRSTRRSRR